MCLSESALCFIALLRAGLWEHKCRLSTFNHIDFSEIYRFAKEQAVVGLVTAGIEHISDVKPPKESVLSFVGETLQMEQHNMAMNDFIGIISRKMHEAGITPVLVKGQGIAQCFERPLWRACGDVDFLFNDKNFYSAVEFLAPLANNVGEEEKPHKHLALEIDKWEVELHGTLHSRLWKKLERVIDSIQYQVFSEGYTREWINGDTIVLLPRADEDVIFIFSHILQHFFKEGIGLKQICDWCRLLWTYRGNIDVQLLQHRLKEAGIMTEWKAFASLAVDVLGMPADAIPFYNPSKRWSRKAGRILSFILETGNMGHNRDLSYYKKYPYLTRKIISVWRHSHDSLLYLMIFPWDTVKTWFTMVKYGIKQTIVGK